MGGTHARTVEESRDLYVRVGDVFVDDSSCHRYLSVTFLLNDSCYHRYVFATPQSYRYVLTTLSLNDAYRCCFCLLSVARGAAAISCVYRRRLLSLLQYK